MSHIRIEPVFWADHQGTLRELRERVFIQEQGVPAELEWDCHDETALHWLITQDEKPIGCARIVIDPRQIGVAKLGRVAILPGFRRQGAGSHLLQGLVDQAPERIFRHGYHCQQLQADVQCSAASFYLTNGWHFLPQETHHAPNAKAPIPKLHWDADIPHVLMAFELKNRDTRQQQWLRLGFDKARYRWHSKDGISDIALIQLLICQNPAYMSLTITDIQQPIWQHKTTIQVLSDYLRGSPRREVQILIQKEYRGIQEHPLLQLSQRISSRLNIRRSEEFSTSQLLAWPYGYLNWTTHSGEACFNNRRECEQRKRNFELIRDNSSALHEGRRIHL